MNFCLLKWLECTEVSCHPDGVGIRVALGADSCIVRGPKASGRISRSKVDTREEPPWSGSGDPDEKIMKVQQHLGRCYSDRSILLGNRPAAETSTLNWEKPKNSIERLTCSACRSAVDWFSAQRCNLAEKYDQSAKGWYNVKPLCTPLKLWRTTLFVFRVGN